MVTFGERLRLLRKGKNISMSEFAKLMNSGKTTISNWENDNRFPDRDMLIKLANFFNVSLDFLIGRTDVEYADIVKETIDGYEYEFKIDRNVYPNGLSREEIIEKLEILKKLEDAGFEYKPKE